MKKVEHKNYKRSVWTDVMNALSMQMYKVVFFVCLLILSIGVKAQTGIGDNFNNNTLSCKWNTNTNYALNETGSELVVTGNNAGTSYNNFKILFDPINVSTNPVVSIQIKTTTALNVRMDLVDANGNITNASPV